MSSGAELPAGRGRFITLEGGEGVGKSTQLARLMDRLAVAGVPALATREPGGTPLAERYRAALLGGAIAPFGPAAEALVFSAARIDHIDAVIGPALARGTTVVCDRFMDSTRAYQGALGHLEAGLVDALERAVVGVRRPDLTLVLDLPSEVALARAAARRGPGQGADRFEREEGSFHETLRGAFLAIAAADPARCRVIDAAGEADTVAAAVWQAVAGVLFSKMAGAPA